MGDIERIKEKLQYDVVQRDMMIDKLYDESIYVLSVKYLVNGLKGLLNQKESNSLFSEKSVDRWD